MLAVVGGLATSGPTAVIYGGSMEPSVRRGDIVLNDQIDVAGLAAGAVVLFESDERLVTHRVVDLADGKVQTKGDANPAPDSTWQPITTLQGKARLVVPFVGLPRVWMRESNWLFLCLWVAAALVAFEVAFRLPTDASEIEEVGSTEGGDF